MWHGALSLTSYTSSASSIMSLGYSSIILSLRSVYQSCNVFMYSTESNDVFVIFRGDNVVEVMAPHTMIDPPANLVTETILRFL